MKNVTIAVLRGGPSSEYEVSLKSGAAVLNTLADDYKVVDIFIDKSGQWHKNGIPMTQANALKGVDVVVIALHGKYGEDGTVQRELDMLGVPYTGSGSYASALAMSKPRARFSVQALPMIKLPDHYVVREDDIQQQGDCEKVAQDIFKRFGPPYIVKPANGGSSVGIMIIKSIVDLPNAIEFVSKKEGFPVLVEQYILGKEVTCGVIEKYRDADYYALPPIEVILPKNKDIFDYDAKYSTDEKQCAQEICPANLSKEEKRHIEEAAKAVHYALDLSHYSRSDFILAPHGLYFLEVNTLPGLTEQSLLPKSLSAIGANLKEFLEHTITLALERK